MLHSQICFLHTIESIHDDDISETKFWTEMMTYLQKSSTGVPSRYTINVLVSLPQSGPSCSIGSSCGHFKASWWEINNVVCQRTICKNNRGPWVFWRIIFSKVCKRALQWWVSRNNELLRKLFENNKKSNEC